MDVAALTPPRRPFAAAAAASLAIHAIAIVWIASALAPSWPRMPEPTAMPELVVTMAPAVASADNAARATAPADVAAMMIAEPAPAAARRDAAAHRPKRTPTVATMAQVEPASPSLAIARGPAESTIDPDVSAAGRDAPPSPVREKATVASYTPASRDGAASATASGDRTTAPVASPSGPPSPVAYREHPAPAYPERARRNGEQGLAIVEALVARDGAPTDVTLASSSGYATLDAAAVAAVWQWRFVPATRDGLPIVARIRIPLRFRLTDDER